MAALQENVSDFEGESRHCGRILSKRFFIAIWGAVAAVAHMLFIPLPRGAHVRGMWPIRTRFPSSALLKVKYQANEEDDMQT